MTPPLAFKMTPTPSEMAFDPPTQISSFLSWRRFFFLEKKNSGKKNSGKKFSGKKIFGVSFKPKKPESAIKNVSPAPLSPPLRRFFMTPPSKKIYDPPSSSKELAHLWSAASSYDIEIHFNRTRYDYR